MWEYNCNKIIKSTKQGNEYSLETKVLGPVLIEEKTSKALILELLSQGYISHSKVSVNFDLANPLVFSQETEEPILELIPMI